MSMIQIVILLLKLNLDGGGSIFAAFSTGFATALWITTYKIFDIKSGAYPDMPQNQIEQQYNEALPYLILDGL